jgi:PAS domain S-box-containing protein
METAAKTAPSTDIDAVALRSRIAELEKDELENVFGYLSLLKVGSCKMRGTKEATYICSRDGSFIDANEEMTSLLGYEADDLIGRRLGVICVNPSDVDRLYDEVERKGYVIDYRMKLLKKGGEELSCLVTSTVRWYNDDRIRDNEPLFKSWVRKER